MKSVKSIPRMNRGNSRKAKSIAIIMAVYVACVSLSVMPAFAETGQTLDEVIAENSVAEEYVGDNGNSSVDAVIADNNVDNGFVSDENRSAYNQQYINDLSDATKLDEPSPGASKINAGVKKVASVIVQVLSYVTTAALVIRVLLDLAYVAIPFFRPLLGGANAQAGMGQQGGMGMNGGMGGMGMSGGMGMGMSGGYGMNRGMGGMGMNNGMGQQGQAGPSLPLVSNAAIQATSMPTPLKAYAKDMVIVLVLAPILLVLAISGALTDLGFMLGGAIANLVSGIGGMI